MQIQILSSIVSNAFTFSLPPKLSPNPRQREMSRKPKPTSNSSMLTFKAGTPVEISSDEVGFRGSWFTGTIIRRASKKNPTKYLIEYTHLFSDESGTKPLREIVELGQLRPVAPREKDREFNFSEEVDAFYNDGWWEGTITGVKDGKFQVYFRSTKEQIEFAKEDLRLHREWVHGEWKPPLEEEDNMKVSTETTEEEPEKDLTVEKFGKGTLVEVSSDEDGFEGAWYAATLIEPVGKDKYLIQYQSLRTEDDSEFLREEVDSLHIRPYPPETVVVDRFNKLDEVDALYNDGWWVGMISKVLSNSRYMVYFKNTNEEMQFDHSSLRLHQDWIDDKWITASKGLKL